MLWHITIFGFGFLGVVFCMVYAGLLMIPKTRTTEMLYSQSQQVASLGCSAAEQVLEARPDCTVRVHALRRGDTQKLGTENLLQLYVVDMRPGLGLLPVRVQRKWDVGPTIGNMNVEQQAHFGNGEVAQQQPGGSSAD